ncbi:hypothetical protein DPMN_134108 [Dreissena polymorpha]|uniref:Uncharacterized protein n=1 Tax=Dreissena polymorpha TaxID=45954 RepID=A0A9D4FZI8_DREPO|nr:hypothetical protein DPMN_134108 [Dreissena polymorpha]
MIEQHVNASVFLLETDIFAIFESAIEGEYSWIESSIQDHTSVLSSFGNYGAGKGKCLSMKTARNYGFSS